MSSEMGEPSKAFVSTLLPLSETVSWRLHNISEMSQNSAWSAMNLPLEVGWGPTGLTKWEISLTSTSSMLLAEVRLVGVAPSAAAVGPRVSHHLTVWIKRHGTYSLVKNPDDFHRCKDISVGGGPSHWKIVPLEDLVDGGCGIRDVEEDCVDFVLKLTVFGQDLSQNSD